MKVTIKHTLSNFTRESLLRRDWERAFAMLERDLESEGAMLGKKKKKKP